MRKTLIIIALLATCLLGTNAFAGPAKKASAAEAKNDGAELIGTKVCKTTPGSIEQSISTRFGDRQKTVEGMVDIVGFIESANPASKKIQIRIAGINFRSVDTGNPETSSTRDFFGGGYKPIQSSLDSFNNYKSGGVKLTLNGLLWDNTFDWPNCQ